jgi:hypothetical protein
MHGDFRRALTHSCLAALAIVCGTTACTDDAPVGPPGEERPLIKPSFESTAQYGCAAPVLIFGLGSSCGLLYTLGAQYYDIPNNQFWGYKNGGPITVTFSGPLKSLTLDVLAQLGPGPGTARADVIDTSGAVLESRDITAGGTFTFAKPGMGGILIYTPLGDDPPFFLFSNVHFVPDCARPSDPNRNLIVESDEVRRTFAEALTLSNVDSTNLHLRHEVGGWIYRRPDGSFFAKIWPDPEGTSKSCAISIPSAPPDSGGVPAGKFHVHPHQDGDDVFGYDPTSEPRGCPDIPAGKVGDARPYENGGGSGPDWGSSFNDDPLLTVAPGRKDRRKAQIYYLDPRRGDTESNPYRWAMSRDTTAACPSSLN